LSKFHETVSLAYAVCEMVNTW